MIDVYIDDIKIKTLGYDGDKNQLAIENGENKAMLIFDDDVLYQLYILVKNRGEMKGLIPIYDKSEPITVKIANAADAEEVRHGAWEIVGRTKSNSAILKCSCCQRVRKGHGKSSYCPDCGAKMDIVLSINRAEENCKED